MLNLMRWGKGKHHNGNLPVRYEQDAFASLQDEMNRLLDHFHRQFGLEPFGAGTEWTGEWMPRVNVKENEKEILISAELPGLDEKDLDISLAGGSLTIKGEKKEEKEEKGKNFFRCERTFGSFTRSIPLPCAVEEAKCEATFKKGVLSVRLMKSAEARKNVKKIVVKHG